MVVLQKKSMRIGELATTCGLSADAIRFYEKAGLLKEPCRSEGGYRQYSQADAESLLFIRRLQNLGFSLKEVREFQILQAEKPDCCSDIRELLEHKLADVRQKVKQLAVLENGLARSLGKCNRQLKKSASQHVNCPVLEQLHSDRAVRT
jgi:MerR family transcriptional regulator, mercuric resistance operon regulatory protein